MGCIRELDYAISMMMISSNSCARKAGKERGEYGGILGDQESNADYRGMVKPNQW